MFYLMPDTKEIKDMLSLYSEYYEEEFNAFDVEKVYTIAALSIGYQAARTLYWVIDILKSDDYEGHNKEEIIKDLRKSLDELKCEHSDPEHILGNDLWETS